MIKNVYLLEELNLKGAKLMIADIEKFIYNDKIYSKCSVSDKEMIDACLHGVRQQIETFKDAYKQVQDEIMIMR